MIICAGCERPILDRFLFNVLDRAWHSTCVQCSDCAGPLTDKCFSREGKLFCKEDFFRRFGTKCGGCSQGISPNDLVRRARNKVFHLKCFTCMVCRKQLSTGEELYVLDENKFICKEDYLSSKYSHGSDDDLDLDSTSMLDKFDDRLSDKGSIADDCDSRDSSLPPSLPPLRLEGGPPQLMDGGGMGVGMDGLPGNHPSLLGKSPSDAVTVKIEKNNNDINTSSSGSSGSVKSTPDAGNNKENSGGKGLGEDGEEKESTDGEEGDDKKKTTGTKRRGPRTTIKAKQLEILKSAFAATPKPTRHIREQLATETGLNMRVIQVWFQNRRSKERRMKQLSALGARRAFFRNPRRMRGLGPEEDFGGPGFAYFDNGEYYPGPFPGGYPGDFYPGQDPTTMNFLPPTSGPQGTPPMDQQGIPVGPMPSHEYPPPPVMPHEMMQGAPPPTSSPEPGHPNHPQNMEPFMRGPGHFPMHPGEMQQPTESW